MKNNNKRNCCSDRYYQNCNNLQFTALGLVNRNKNYRRNIANNTINEDNIQSNENNSRNNNNNSSNNYGNKNDNSRSSNSSDNNGNRSS